MMLPRFRALHTHSRLEVDAVVRTQQEAEMLIRVLRLYKEMIWPDEAPAQSPEAAASQNEDHESREVLGSSPAEIGTDGDCSQPKTETV